MLAAESLLVGVLLLPNNGCACYGDGRCEESD